MKEPLKKRVSLAQQIEEVARELKLREGVYARKCSTGAMRPAVAEFHLARMRAVHDTLVWLESHEAEIRRKLGAAA